MGHARFAVEDESGRDALTGAPLGDPVVALRVGLALAFAIALARVGGPALAKALSGLPSRTSWIDWQVGFAAGLPIGVALTVMVWRDRPGRSLPFRAGEAVLLALVTDVALVSWAFFHLQTAIRRSESNWWLSLTMDWQTRLPDVIGDALGLLLAARMRGRYALGAAFAVPTSIATAVTQLVWWPDYFAVGGLLGFCAVLTLVAPLSDRALLRLARSLRQEPAS